MGPQLGCVAVWPLKIGVSPAQSESCAISMKFVKLSPIFEGGVQPRIYFVKDQAIPCGQSSGYVGPHGAASPP